MGCITSKDKTQNSPKERLSRKGSLDRRVAHVNSARRDEGIRLKEKSDNGDAKVMLIDKRMKTSNRFNELKLETQQIENRNEKTKVENSGDGPHFERRTTEKHDSSILGLPGSRRIPKGLEAEQVAAGWPSWLASAAGEAIKGWVPRRANTYEKLERIGQGTYSSVYKARDIINNKLVALKKVRFDCTDAESVRFMAREIAILRRLDHPNIIKLEGLITSQTSSILYLVFEYMEHDLTGIASIPGIKFKESQIKCYMRQLLSGLAHCHSRGVLHRDIKGSNLLIDDNGVLKIADFGLASFFDPRSSAPLTSRVVTLWYRAPELLLGASRYDVAVDLWSTGCILGELYSGKPILPGRTEVEQLHKIFKLCGSPSEDYWRKAKLPHSSVIKPQRPYRPCVAETFKNFPVPAVKLMETLLSMDPSLRGTAAFALRSEYFTTEPFACDPSSLPKYPPSKEIDAKLRDEEARRQGAAGIQSKLKESQNSVAPNVDPGLATSVHGRRHSNAHGRVAMFNSQNERTGSGILVDPSNYAEPVKEGRRDTLDHRRRKVSHSGPLFRGGGLARGGSLTKGSSLTKAGKDVDNPHVVTGRLNLSTMSGLVAARTSMPEDRQEKPSTSQTEVTKLVGRFQRPVNGVESTVNHDQNHQIEKMQDSPEAGGGKSSTGDSSLYARSRRGNKIYVSGPLLPSNEMDQMLKEHDRQIQEYARRRLDRTKVGKMNPQGKQATDNLIVGPIR